MKTIPISLAFFLALVPVFSFAATTVGNLESIDQNGFVSGWVFDPDMSSQSISVTLILDGLAGTGTTIAWVPADGARADVNNAHRITGNHGFSAQIPIKYLNGQAHTLYVYGIDTDPNTTNVQIQDSPKPFQIVLHDPTGSLDAIDSTGTATGWALDPDSTSQPIDVHFYIDQPAVDGGGTYLGLISANQPRADVNTVTGYSGDHGFSFRIPDAYRDGTTHTLYAYGINKDGTVGTTALLTNAPKSFTLPTPLVSTLGNATISASGITIKTTARLAGAIDSLQWNGKEFVDSHDHGRQIQTAWTGNGLGECFNPTEAGSAADGEGLHTTSRLLSLTAHANTITTVNHPAFWQTPGMYGGGCNFDAAYPGLWHGGTTVNTTPTTEALLQKTVTIGYAGIPNIIEYVSEITLSAHELAQVPLKYLILENPAVYMPNDFSKVYRFDPRSDVLTELGPIVPHFSSYGMAPIISATANGAYAIGLYTDEIPWSGFPQNEQKDYTGYGFTDWITVRSMDTRIPKTPPSGSTFSAGTYHYRTFIIIGTLQDVQTSTEKLYQLLSHLPAATLAPPPLFSVPAVLPAPKNSSGQNYCAIITRNLLVGSRGADVTTLQTFLAKSQTIYPERLITGHYGLATMRAVQRWQVYNGIVSSGTAMTTGFGAIGPRTRTAMSAPCANR